MRGGGLASARHPPPVGTLAESFAAPSPLMGMLTQGSTAPNLTLDDALGAPLTLAELRGQPVLLYLMRSASCHVCNAHVRDLVSRQADLDVAGVRTIVVLPEARDVATAWKEQRRIPFTVVTGSTSSGPLGSTHEELGFARRMLGSMQQSGTVLIDERGVVRHTRISTMPTGAYDKTGLWAAIDGLASATLKVPERS